jgi:hypothetical protein
MPNRSPDFLNMKKNLFINFCPRLHPDHGGTYTAASLFRRAVESYFIDVQMPGYDSPSEADYTVSGSITKFHQNALEI